MNNFPELPLFHHLDRISAALQEKKCAVIAAEPGAGKTMLVPVLVRSLASGGLTVLVEPRRIAARAAAHGIAGMHGLQTGRDTGFVVRGESCRCDDDGILAVTPGILLQMLQEDPALEKVSALIFDEFHERSADADLALALVLDMRSSLREDLLLTVMSATMEHERTGQFLSSPVITVPGRGFPVDIRYRENIAHPRDIPRMTARAVLENLHVTPGHILVFLPGAMEISRCSEMLQHLQDQGFIICQLHGSLPLDRQRAALSPVPPGIRKIILATNVAESSLTIDHVDCVIDCGWEKRAEWQPGAQMNFLENRRITRASAIQRAGRAGRTAPGVAIRCFDRLTFDRMNSSIPPEILRTELSGLCLAIGCWGSRIDDLQFMDAPPLPAVAAGEKLLRELALFTPDNRPSSAGKKAAALPLSPRLAAMMIFSPPELRRIAAGFAAILEEKDDFAAYNTADLQERFRRMLANNSSFHIQKSVYQRLLKLFPPEVEPENADCGLPVAIAFPEWIARRRTENTVIYQLANGSAAAVQEDDFLRQEEFIAIARLDGTASANAAVRLAVPVKKESIEKYFAGRIAEKCTTIFDQNTEKLLSFNERKLGELTLHSRPCATSRAMIIPALLKEAFRRRIELPPPEDKRAHALAVRLNFARNSGLTGVPEINADFLLSLAPYFPDNINSLADLKKTNWHHLLHNNLDFNVLQMLERFCPEFFTAPTGMTFPIDYSGEQPTLSIQIQQLYGVTTHPVVGKNHIPLRIELLSPARRPVQISCDLPGFWQGSWKLVRSEMRGRYPKHEWPEDPARALPMRHSVKR
ncbi:MAG: ATP-dependent helicase HrpB [Lentisphaeria bacterium]|nr:ATP-dependent helicase HrpB [Lentisphaeria bacterium]